MQQSMFQDHTYDSVVSVAYQRHAPALLTYLQLHLPTYEDAEDVLVEVFLAALEGWRFKSMSEDEQRRWLWRVAHNKVADYYRRTGRDESTTLEHIAETIYYDEMLAPEQLALQGEEYAHLHHTIQRLPKVQQQVLRLRFVNGLRSSEIANVMGKKDGAIRMLLVRTLRFLRASYGQR